MTVAGPAQDIVTALEVVVLGAFAAVGVSAWLVCRAVRRRYRQLRARIGLPTTSPAWWQAQRDRHRMWRAVSAAERSVSGAARADAPVGDLPLLVRRLRTNADSVDRLLSTTSDLPGRSPRVEAELQQLLDTAESIRRAALESLLEVATPASSSLADAVADEVSALRHGLSVAALTRR